jgi:hypothetical protein
MSFSLKVFRNIKHLKLRLFFGLLLWLFIIIAFALPNYVQSHTGNRVLEPNGKHRLWYLLNRPQDVEVSCGQLKGLWEIYTRKKADYSNFVSFLIYHDLENNKKKEEIDEQPISLSMYKELFPFDNFDWSVKEASDFNMPPKPSETVQSYLNPHSQDGLTIKPIKEAANIFMAHR